MIHHVTLDRREMQRAASEGADRQIDNLLAGRRDRHGCGPDDGWQQHTVGCIGELAFAKWSGRYWCGKLGKLTPGDVGSDEIRATTWDNGKLRISEDDADDRPFILVTGRAPVVTLRGWLWGREGKLREYWWDPSGKGRPNYFVPQNKIRPMPEKPNDLRRSLLAPLIMEGV